MLVTFNMMYWWWIQSGSLFTAYLLICINIAVLVVYYLDSLYQDELKPILYRVVWRSLITGYSGGGTQGYPRDMAQHYADTLNENHLNLHHWIEEI
jgi:hypothetical protein